MLVTNDGLTVAVVVVETVVGALTTSVMVAAVLTVNETKSVSVDAAVAVAEKTSVVMLVAVDSSKTVDVCEKASREHTARDKDSYARLSHPR